MEITIANLYPDLLNLYGDAGNISTLKRRLELRGIDVTVKEYSINDEIDLENTDILFIGGGSDKEQKAVAGRLCEIKDSLKAYRDKGKVILAVCGGFEVICNSYKLGKEVIKGAGILDINCDYSKERLTGNVILESDLTGSTIVGFENHNGRITQNKYPPLGKVIYGNGSDGSKTNEGVADNNTFATYLHGPLLPKNPKLADYILEKALEKKYGKTELATLDDEFEEKAHQYILDTYK